MRKQIALLRFAACALLLAGCVEQRYVVTTDPPGAVVFRNGQPLGQSPVDDHFVYYGSYHFTIVQDGYETLQVDQDITTPWYEYFPLDFFSENIIPWIIRDVRRFHYKLEPRRMVNTEELLKQADNLRNRGISIRPPDNNPPP
jgi:PEGA domain